MRTTLVYNEEHLGKVFTVLVEDIIGYHTFLLNLLSYELRSISACHHAGICSNYGHKLWVCSDEWSAPPSTKPNTSASSKGCQQPSWVIYQPSCIFPWGCLVACLPSHLLLLWLFLWQSTRNCWGDLGRVPFKGNWNCCRLGSDGWDEGNWKETFWTFT